MIEEKVTFKKQIKKVVALSTVFLMCVLTVFSVSALSRKVTINVDGETLSTVSLSTDPNKILNSMEIEMHSGDVVDSKDVEDGSLLLEVKRAFDVIVKEENSEEKNLKMAKGTVSDAVRLAGKELTEKHLTNHNLNLEVQPNMEIKIMNCVKIFVSADGQEGEHLAPLGTVGKAIEFLQIPLSSEDILNVDIDSNIYEGMEIRVKRVVYREIVRNEEIPFEKITKKSTLVPSGQSQVSQQGKEGEKEVVIREVIIDGNVEKSEIIKTTVINQPMNEVIFVGSGKESVEKAVSAPPSQPSNKNETLDGYRKVKTGSVTAYTAGHDCGFRTATGTTPKSRDTIAVDFRFVPRGSQVWLRSDDGKVNVKGYARDTGGAMRNGSAVADVYMDSVAECRKFGRKHNVSLYVKN